MPDAPKPRRRASADGLPSAPDAERVILGSILLNQSALASTAQALQPEEFADTRHQQIFQRMLDLQERGEQVDRITVANELTKHGQFEATGGLTYLTSLDADLPPMPNPGAYVAIVKEKARLRAYVYASRKVAALASAGEALASEVYRQAQVEFGKIGDGATGSQVESVQEFIDNYPGGVSTFLDPGKWKPGISTGFSKVDEWTGGFHDCEIFLIGARPGLGKSALCSGIVKNLAERGYTSLFFSMEMSKEKLMQRLICQDAQVSLPRFRGGELDDFERKRVTESTGRIASLPIYFDEQGDLSVPEIGMRLKALMNERPVALWAVDYAQLIRSSQGHRYQNENEMFTRVANELQALVKSTRVPLLLLSQLTREPEKAAGDKRPRLYQCRGAGAWEQIADFGALIFREYLYKRDRADLENKAELIVDKNRSGPMGTINLRFTPYLMKFEGEGS